MTVIEVFCKLDTSEPRGASWPITGELGIPGTSLATSWLWYKKEGGEMAEEGNGCGQRQKECDGGGGEEGGGLLGLW